MKVTNDNKHDAERAEDRTTERDPGLDAAEQLSRLQFNSSLIESQTQLIEETGCGWCDSMPCKCIDTVVVIDQSIQQWDPDGFGCEFCFRQPCTCPLCPDCAVPARGCRCLRQRILAFLEIMNISELPHKVKHMLVNVSEARLAVAAEPESVTDYWYVTQSEHLAAMVTDLAKLPTDSPNIGFDMEANNLGHESFLSYLQIRDYHNRVSYLVDLLVLQKAAWTTTGADGRTTLKTIFEDPTRTKLIFDTRQDSACLYARAGIKLRGILDCQYLHMLTYNECPQSRPGLTQSIELLAKLSPAALQTWKGTKTCHRDHGTWERRPVPAQARAYALGDVELLRAVHDTAECMLNDRGMALARHWSATEVWRTWRPAWAYTTSKSATHMKFAKVKFSACWDGPLLKPGVSPNLVPIPRTQADPY